MKTVIAEEQARKEIAEWADFFEAELTEDDIKTLLPAVMRGRVVFEEDSETFIIDLKSPITLKTGEEITQFTMREPETKELQDSEKYKNDMAKTVFLYSALSGQPLGVVQRLKQRDFITLSGVFSFFG